MNEIYQEKLISVSDAVGMIEDGDRVFVGSGSSFPYAVLDELWAQKDRLHDIIIIGSNGFQYTKLYDEVEDNPFHFLTYFIGVNEKKQYKARNDIKYTSIHLSDFELWVNKVARPNVCIYEVSMPDQNGYMSFGPSGVSSASSTMKYADKIIVQVNRYTPYVMGNHNLIHVSEVDAIVEADVAYDSFVTKEPDEISQKIADQILPHIKDGSTVQLGLGNVSTAIGYGLKERNDLGIHSELLSMPLMELIKNKNVTNRNKSFLDGRSVFAFALTDQEGYDFMDHNPEFYSAPYTFVNDPRVIARNRNMISINTAMSVNLFGEVAADSIGWRQVSGIGGQLDYVRGSQWSEGGKSFIALPSSMMSHGKFTSKIVSHFPEGTAVTSPRSDVQYIATEYGCVNLKELTMDDRVRAMISIAHPDYRQQLMDEAREHHLL